MGMKIGTPVRTKTHAGVIAELYEDNTGRPMACIEIPGRTAQINVPVDLLEPMYKSDVEIPGGEQK